MSASMKTCLCLLLVFTPLCLAYLYPKRRDPEDQALRQSRKKTYISVQVPVDDLYAALKSYEKTNRYEAVKYERKPKELAWREGAAADPELVSSSEVLPKNVVRFLCLITGSFQRKELLNTDTLPVLVMEPVRVRAFYPLIGYYTYKRVSGVERHFVSSISEGPQGNILVSSYRITTNNLPKIRPDGILSSNLTKSDLLQNPVCKGEYELQPDGSFDLEKASCEDNFFEGDVEKYLSQLSCNGIVSSTTPSSKSKHVLLKRTTFHVPSWFTDRAKNLCKSCISNSLPNLL